LQFQNYAGALGYEPYSKDEVAQAKVYRDKLCSQYGKDFGANNGWAAEALSKSDPKFSDIERASGLERLRPYYKMASHNVHANPKGIQFRLGLSKGLNVLLAGPSNYGPVV
jgi:uncharacterized protein DUF5677